MAEPSSRRSLRTASVLDALRAADLSVAAAESLTGGLLLATLTDIPGSSAVVRGGFVVYATELKHALAGVPAELLADRGPVDPDVADALAAGARLRCGAALGLGLTGVAGPDPQHGHPPGTWFVSLVDAAGSVSRRAGRPGDPHAVVTRADVRWAAVDAALELLGAIAEVSPLNRSDDEQGTSTTSTALDR